jgi:hypothetical protein
MYIKALSGGACGFSPAFRHKCSASKFHRFVEKNVSEHPQLFSRNCKTLGLFAPLLPSNLSPAELLRQRYHSDSSSLLPHYKRYRADQNRYALLFMFHKKKVHYRICFNSLPNGWSWGGAPLAKGRRALTQKHTQQRWLPQRN